jgi:chorismate mutase
MLKIKELREQIKKIDATLVKTLAKRQALSKQIGQLKLEQGKEIVDLSQEKKLFEFYEELSERYDLQKPFIKRIFKMIIAHSRRIQKY